MAPILLAGMGFMSLMVMPSSASISLEGKSFWILKTLPLDVFKIFSAKIALSFIVAGGSMIFSSLLLGYAFSLNIFDVLILVVFSGLSTFFMSALCLFINLLLPKMDTENDAAAVKQSASILVCMLLGWLVVGLFAALFFVLGGNFYLLGIIGSLLFVALSGLVLWMLNTIGRKNFANI